MKMVAAAKLKRAQDAAEESHPYAESMSKMIVQIAKEVQIDDESPKLLVGTGKEDVHMLVVMSADRGLCGGFNANVIRLAHQRVIDLESEGKVVKVVTVGRKATVAFKRLHKDKIVKSFDNLAGKEVIGFAAARRVAEFVIGQFEDGEFDVCTMIYNRFLSIMTQKPTPQQVIPFTLQSIDLANDNDDAHAVRTEDDTAILADESSPYSFEPSQQDIFNELLPKNLSVQIFTALLDGAAGEQAARMTAMDNATRNAGDLIKDLTLQYNRARQAHITKELIEIISGAEAV
jgi:F-type H+-transporting ATPase subunit gamma